MEKLKIGDIKKFENGVVGVVLEVMSRDYAVFTLDGKTYHIPNTMSCVSPRLKPETRALLMEVGNAKIEYEKAREAVSNAYIEASRKGDYLKKVKERVVTAGQSMDLKQFKECLIHYLGNKYNKLVNNDYSLKVRYSAGAVSVDIVKSKIVKKYVNPDNTPFVTYEYDNTLLIEWSSSAYSQALIAEGKKSLDFESSDSKVLFSETRDFSIGDKSSLIYNQRVSYTLLSGYLNEETAKKFAEGIVIR